MNLRQGLEKLKYDVRMIDLNVRTGVLTQGEVKKHIDSLDDTKDNTAPLNIDENEAPSYDAD